MIEQLTQALSLTDDQTAKLLSWIKDNVRSKSFSVLIPEPDVRQIAPSGNIDSVIDYYRQKAAIEARLFHQPTISYVNNGTGETKPYVSTDPAPDDSWSLSISFKVQAIR